MFSSLRMRARSKAGTDLCTAEGLRKISVEPHQIITSRSAPDDFLKSRISWRNCSASSRLFLPFLTLGPSSLRT